jgi:Holliday junction DNA helicase RuvB
MIERITDPREQAEDQQASLVEPLRPKNIKSYIGQNKIKQNLAIAIESAKMRGDALDHLLFYGPPGLGKTTLAQIIATEMGANIRITAGPALTRAGDLVALLSNLQDKDVLFIDEIHRLSKNIEEILYTAMEDFAIDVVMGKGIGAQTLRLDLPKFTLIGATTRLGLISNPLRDRFGIPLRLDFYEPIDLEQIIFRAASILKAIGISSRGSKMEFFSYCFSASEGFLTSSKV